LVHQLLADGVNVLHFKGQMAKVTPRNFGHLAFEVEDIYAICQKLMNQGVTINRPPRDGWMAFIRSPDQISIELLQKGAALPPQEPWASMPNTGTW
jgi:Lactoylglutathione lyase and related lyases